MAGHINDDFFFFFKSIVSKYSFRKIYYFPSMFTYFKKTQLTKEFVSPVMYKSGNMQTYNQVTVIKAISLHTYLGRGGGTILKHF